MNHKEEIRGIACTSAGAIGWGLSGVCSQALFAEYGISSGWLTAVRMVFAGILLLLMSMRQKKMGTFAIFKNARDVLQLFLFAICGLLLCQFTFMSAIRYSNSATATVLQSLNVVLMAVLVAVHDRINLTARQMAAVALAVLGTFFIASKGHLSGLSFTGTGLGMGLLSAVGVVSYTLLAKPIICKHGSICVTGWGMLVGGIAASFATQAWKIPTGLDLRALLLLFVIVTIGTAVGFSAFLEGSKFIGPSRATLLGCLEPASSAVFSFLFLGPRFGLFEILGFSSIMATVFLSTASSKPVSGKVKTASTGSSLT